MIFRLVIGITNLKTKLSHLAYDTELHKFKVECYSYQAASNINRSLHNGFFAEFLTVEYHKQPSYAASLINMQNRYFPQADKNKT